VTLVIRKVEMRYVIVMMLTLLFSSTAFSAECHYLCKSGQKPPTPVVVVENPRGADYEKAVKGGYTIQPKTKPMARPKQVRVEKFVCDSTGCEKIVQYITVYE